VQQDATIQENVSIVPRFLNSVETEATGQLHASAALTPQKEPRYPLDSSLGQTQGRLGHFGADKISSLSGTEFGTSNPVACRYID
jgi:hypothetical protein